ncbi:MAG: hypothetical protein HQM14_20480 [SAR324 cluster bacterium]|nr:hypothetical protein [SAR324 cluster bacterium]
MMHLRWYWNRHWARYLITLFVLFQFGDVIFGEGTLNTLQNSPAAWVYDSPEYHGWLEKTLLNRFPPPLSGHRAHWDRPLANDPVIKTANDLLLKGEFPWLNPYLGLGVPLFADGITPTFFIGNLFFMFADSQYWDWFYLGLFFISGLMLFQIFSRYFHLEGKASFAGTLIYLSSGLFAPQMTYMNAGEALNIYLFIFGIYWIEVFRLTKRWSHKFGSSLLIIFCVTQTVYAAMPEGTVANYFMLCGYLLLRLKLKPWNHFRQSATWIFFIFAIALLLSAPYLFALQYNSNMMVWEHKVGRNLLPPRNIVDTFLPYFRGWSTNNFFPPFPDQLGVIYLGVFPLAAFFFWLCHFSEFQNKKRWFPFFLIMLFYFSQSFGFYQWNLNFVGILPVLDRIFFWRFFPSLYIFSACLLTAKVVHDLVLGKVFFRFRFLISLWGSVILYFLFLHDLAPFVAEINNSPDLKYEFIAWNRTNSVFILLIALVFSFPYCFPKYFLHERQRKHWTTLLVGTVFIYSSSSFSKTFYHKQDSFADTSALIFLKKKINEGELFRIFSPNLYYPATASGYGVPDIRFLAPIVPAGMVDVFKSVFGEYVKGRLRIDRLDSINELDGGETYEHPGFDLLNVRYLIFNSDHDALPSGMNFKERFRDDSTVIIENLDVKERFFLISEWKVFSEKESWLQAIQANPNALLKTVFLREAPIWPNLDLPSASDSSPPLLVEKTNHSYLLKIQLKEPQFLMISDLYYKDYKASIDGQRIPVQAVNGGLIGLALPAGNYLLDLRFEHPFVFLGIVLFVLGLVILIFVWWEGRKYYSSS